MSTSYAMQVTRVTTAQLATMTGADGMIVYNVDTDQMVVMDGTTVGGNAMLDADAVDDAIQAEVTNFTASGGQTLPTIGTPTPAGSVVTWDGNAWDESADFALKADVAQDFADLAPASGNTATGSALRWNNNKLENFVLPASGGSGGLSAPIKTTDADKILAWNITTSNWEERDVFELKTDVTAKINTIKGNPVTYTTIQALDAQMTTVTSMATSNNAALGTKPNKPARAPNVGESLTWDHVNGVFDYSTDFVTTSDLATKSTKPNTSSITSPTQNEVLAWDASANSGDGAFIHKDLQPAIDAKAPKPPTGIQAGEFLRWDETNEVFTFATPAGGSGGSSIPTPATTTDYTTAGAMQVLIWDNTSGDLKNVASPFVEPPPASAAGEYLRWDATLGWLNDTPAGGGGGSSFGTPSSGTLANEAVTWDGVSAFVNTTGYAMLTDLTSKADAPTVSTGTNEVLKWNQSTGAFENVALSTTGFTSTGSITPPTNTATGEYLAWNGTSGTFENRSGFINQSVLDGMFPASTASTSNRGALIWDGTKTVNKDFAPATATPNGQFVKWNGTTFENVALSTTGMTTTGFVNPASGSGFTDALQWDATNSVFVNTPNFRPDSTIDTSTGTDDVLGWDGTQFYKKTLSPSTGAGVMELTHDTVNGEYVLSVKASAIAAL
jgi:hypothetical protein